MISNDLCEPVETPSDETVPDIGEVDPYGLGKERLKEDLARTEEDEDA